MSMRDRAVRGVLGGMVGAVFFLVGLWMLLAVTPRVVGVVLGLILMALGGSAAWHSIYRKLILGETDEAEAAREDAQLREELYDEMFERRVVCPGGACGTTALPIPDTRNRYRCRNCGHEFEGEKHGIDVEGMLEPDWDELKRRLGAAE